MEGLCDYMNRRQFAIKPNNVVAHILPEIPYGDLSFGRCYKRQTKSLELYYDAYLHSNRIEKTFQSTTMENLTQAAELAEQGYSVTVFGQIPDEDVFVELAMRITRHGGRILWACLPFT